MRVGVMILALVLASGCDMLKPPVPPALVMPVIEDGGPGYPPKLGEMTLISGADRQLFTTFDFSIGAFDASAWFGRDQGVHALTLRGFPGADPKAEHGILLLKADLPGPPAPGMAAQAVVVKIIDETYPDGRILWSSAGRSAGVEITSVVHDKDSEAYGHATGRFKAVLCDALAPEKNDCHTVTGTFDTGVQFDYL